MQRNATGCSGGVAMTDERIAYRMHIAIDALAESLPLLTESKADTDA